MRSPARYTVEAQDGHRRGVVLGLTLAELLLLLVFCLLLVSAGIIEQKDHQIQQLANAPSSPPGQPDAKDAVAQQLSEKTKELADAGAKFARTFGLKLSAVKSMIVSGKLPTHTVVNPVNRCPMLVIDEEAIELFKSDS